MKINIPEAVLVRAITALQTVAKDRAGHSQAPDKFCKEDTIEWADSMILRRKIREAKQLASVAPVEGE